MNFTRRPSSAGSRGPLVPASRAGAARAAAILLISCHRQSIKGGNKHQRALSDVAEGSSDGLGRQTITILCLCLCLCLCHFLCVAKIRLSRSDTQRGFYHHVAVDVGSLVDVAVISFLPPDVYPTFSGMTHVFIIFKITDPF